MTNKDDLSREGTQLRALAGTLHILSWLFVIAAIVIGVLLMSHTGPGTDSFGLATSTHPWTAVGLGIAIGGIVQGAFIIAFCQGLKVLGGYVEVRCSTSEQSDVLAARA